MTFAFGRRGSTLSTGAKTSSPIDYETAKRTFDELVREKMAKGYTPGPEGTPYQNTDAEARATGILPQLLNPIDEGEVRRLLNHPGWCLQEKFDGRRVLLQKQGGQVRAINRKGLVIGIACCIGVSALNITSSFVLDGECVGDVLYAFDLLEWDGEDYRPKPYQRRLVPLARLIDAPGVAHIQLAETTTDPANKERMFRHLKAEKREGVVLKRLDAPYSPGRPASGGPALKHKFHATLSAVVSKISPQHSVELRLLNCKGWIVIGNVTIPPNHPVPAVGAHNRTCDKLSFGRAGWSKRFKSPSGSLLSSKGSIAEMPAGARSTTIEPSTTAPTRIAPVWSSNRQMFIETPAYQSRMAHP